MGDPRPGLDEATKLPVREMDGVREDGPLPEPAGAVVDVDVIDGVGEEPGDLGDLATVLRHVRLPVRTGGGGERGGLAQQVGRAGDGEPRRDRVPEAAVVGAVPSIDEPRRIRPGSGRG